MSNKKNGTSQQKIWDFENLQDAGERALWRLNNSNTPQSHRVFTILGLYTRMWREWGASTDEISVVLNHHLSRYKWENLLTLDLKPCLRPATNVSGDDLDEYHAIRAVLDLAGTKEGLSRIRQCPECDRWFLAIKRIRKFCTGACKQKDFYSSPQKREEQKERMRVRYRDTKEQDERTKRKVGYAGKKKRSLSA